MKREREKQRRVRWVERIWSITEHRETRDHKHGFCARFLTEWTDGSRQWIHFALLIHFCLVDPAMSEVIWISQLKMFHDPYHISFKSLLFFRKQNILEKNRDTKNEILNDWNIERKNLFSSLIWFIEFHTEFVWFFVNPFFSICSLRITVRLMLKSIWKSQ